MTTMAGTKACRISCTHPSRCLASQEQFEYISDPTTVPSRLPALRGPPRPCGSHGAAGSEPRVTAAGATTPPVAASGVVGASVRQRVGRALRCIGLWTRLRHSVIWSLVTGALPSPMTNVRSDAVVLVTSFLLALLTRVRSDRVRLQ